MFYVILLNELGPVSLLPYFGTSTESAVHYVYMLNGHLNSLGF